MEKITVLVETEINPTEDEEKVKAAVVNMFGDIAVQMQPQTVGRVMIAEAKNLEALRNFQSLLRRDRVRAAARKFLHSNVRGKTVSFCLNKQVAFIGHVSFSQETGECPLGPIRVMIESDNPRELIDWLAPRLT